MNTKIKLLLSVSLIVLSFSCKDSLPIVDDLKNKEYQLVDENNTPVDFPKDFFGKTIVAGYIFTNCPDICPLTTNNMRLVQEELKEQNIENVEFIGISFDPEVDTPEVLKKYAEIRNLDPSNFSFLTGQKSEITKLMKEIGILAVPGDTSYVEEEEIIFYVHTDRISLIDSDGKIRKHYPGSSAIIKEIINDVKLLED